MTQSLKVANFEVLGVDLCIFFFHWVSKLETLQLNTTETLMVRLFGKIFCESGLSGNLITYPGLSLQNFGVLSEHAES